MIGAFDIGIKNSFTFDDGGVFDISVLYSGKLKADQRKMNRLYKMNGKTRNHEKRVEVVRRNYEKLKNKRVEKANQLVHKILTDYDVFAIQDDRFFTWQKGDKGRIMQQSALGRVKAKLKDSSRTIVVPHYFPSTQRCPVCGKDTYHPLEKRDYDCEYCGYHHDLRDQKSAAMILMEALKQNVCVERTAKSPAKAMASAITDASASGDCMPSPIGGYNPSEKQEACAVVMGSSRNRRSII
jgi:transposase